MSSPSSSPIFDFLRFCVGGMTELPSSAGTLSWTALYAFSREQALTGLCFYGIKKAGEVLRENNPVPQKLLVKWFAQAEQIRRQNIRMNVVAGRLYARMSTDGICSCVLKGQGNALLYPDPYSRMPGDIDIWIDAPRRKIIEYAGGRFNCGDVRFHHIETVVGGIPVELHFIPCMMNNPFYNRRMQKWFRQKASQQCSNIVSLPDSAGSIAVPVNSFNVVYQLCHLYHHFFDEGIGMRQIVDYYYVIVGNGHTGQSDVLRRELRHLGLLRFAGAVMYVLRHTLGLPDSKLIVPADTVRGKLLLREILDGGNFGRSFARYGHFTRQSMAKKYFLKIWRNMHFVRYFPSEALAEPFFRTWHFFWRKGRN